MPEKEKWITLKSGKKVQLDENGVIIAGFPGFMGKHISKIGEKEKSVLQPYEQPRKKFESYLQENNGDREKAAKQFFDENLRDKFISTTIDGKNSDIHFTGTSWQKSKMNIKNHPIKANFLEDIPEVLQHYKISGDPDYTRDDFSKFHYFEHVIEKEIKGRKVKVRVKVDVGTRKNSENENEVYHYKATEITQDTKKLVQALEGNYALNGTPSRFSQPAHDKNIRPQYEVVNIEIDILEDAPMNNKRTVSFDSKSKRSFDINGFMHVELSNLTKESVDPYYGYEIVNSEALGFEPEKIYFGYRKCEELAKAAQSFNGLPLMREHHFDSAEKPQREHRVGSVGTNCVYNAPYLQASLTITDGEAIRKIESGERMELSCSYFYKTIVEKGEFNGQPYDFIMTDIQGNHVALVEEGRAGADVRVADSGENVKDIQQNQENITHNPKEEKMAQLEEKKEPVQDEETKEKTCDSELSEESKEAAPAANDDEPEIEETLKSLGVEISDDVKRAFLAGMHFAHKKDEENAALDNELPGENKEAAQAAGDAETESPSEKEAPKAAMDANTIKRQIREEMRGVQLAVRDVRPLVGELDVVAFDSASGVYLEACRLMNVAATKSSARDVCRALLATGNSKPQMVSDSAGSDFQSRFAD